MAQYGITRPQLIYYGIVMPHVDTDQVKIGSGNGLLPYGTKPLPEPMLMYHQMCNVAFA